jgi:hypothetical protein
MLAMCTTLCWSDRTQGVACVDAHTRWLTSKSAFIAMKSPHESAQSLCLKAMNSLTVACSKSSSQSDVGAVARRSKIGAERNYLDVTGVPLYNQGSVYTICRTTQLTDISRDQGWFGNPTIRAIPKMCSSVIQITLKVKSDTSVQNLSPTLSLLCGTKSWVAINKSREIHIHDLHTVVDYQDVVTLCSLYSISRAPHCMKRTLVKSFIDIVLLECRQHLDPAEYECTLLLLSFIVSDVMNTPSGIQTTIDSMYI